LLRLKIQAKPPPIASLLYLSKILAAFTQPLLWAASLAAGQLQPYAGVVVLVGAVERQQVAVVLHEWAGLAA
jgi:hypothetical protein